MNRYLSQIILIIKKQLNRWGINPFFHFKTMSDNIHYVNLMPYQLIKHLKVGNHPYFKHSFQKISRCTPLPAMATPQSSKIQKTLYSNTFGRKKIKKGSDSSSRLCKLADLFLQKGGYIEYEPDDEFKPTKEFEQEMLKLMKQLKNIELPKNIENRIINVRM